MENHTLKFDGKLREINENFTINNDIKNKNNFIKFLTLFNSNDFLKNEIM